jgi:hypothetical protein
VALRHPLRTREANTGGTVQLQLSIGIPALYYCRLPHEPLAPLLQGWADYWMLYFPYSAPNKQELMPSLAGSA